MSEVISVTRAVEIRETFKPSVQLNSTLEAFLNFQKLSQYNESHQATFLFKSWHRRLLKQSSFYSPGREYDFSYRDAAMDFARLPAIPMPLEADVRLFQPKRGARMARLALKPAQTRFSRHALSILDTIPTEEAAETDYDKQDLLYVEIDREDLAYGNDLIRARSSLLGLLSSPETRRSLYVKPHQIVNRDTIVNQEDLS